jgi:RNA polymerase sigma-70 factor (ECF subfamily)
MLDPGSDTQDLIDRAGQGEQGARHRLLGRYRGYLRRMVAARLDRRIASRVDASDVVQETLVVADRRLGDYFSQRVVPFYAWLRQIAEDRIVEAHRLHVGSQKRSVTREDREPERADHFSFALTRQLLADDTSPSHRLIRQEDQEQIRSSIAALPSKDREVLVMRHLEHLSTVEIASRLGISEGAVRARLVRSLVRLQALLESQAGL